LPRRPKPHSIGSADDADTSRRRSRGQLQRLVGWTLRAILFIRNEALSEIGPSAMLRRFRVVVKEVLNVWIISIVTFDLDHFPLSLYSKAPLFETN
jgi:hypothetical protein